MNVTQDREDALVPALYSLSISPLEKPFKRFDQLPIGLNQRPPAYSVSFRGQDDEPGVPLYKFLDVGNRQNHADGREKKCEDERYCVDLNKPLGDTFNKNTKYFNILAKLEWPGYESSGDFLCDCGSGTTRYEIGREFARVWRDYMSQCQDVVFRRTFEGIQTNPVVDGIEFRRMYLSELYYDDEREWEAKLWVELPDHLSSLDFLRM